MVRFESLGPAAGLRIVPALSRRRRLGLSGAATGLHCGQGPEGSGRRSDAGSDGRGRRARRTLSPGSEKFARMFSEFLNFDKQLD